MNIIIKLDHSFQPFAGNRKTVEVKGDTVKECLDNFIGLYPIFKEILFDVGGTLSALVMVEGKAVVPKDLDRPVSRDREITLLPMIQGG
jgi:molybdopterin converting factor small subunit